LAQIAELDAEPGVPGLSAAIAQRCSLVKGCGGFRRRICFTLHNPVPTGTKLANAFYRSRGEMAPVAVPEDGVKL
jgi:hypothetical protein